MKNVISIGILLLFLASGFVIFSFDRSDNGVKFLSSDDYEEMEMGCMEESSEYTPSQNLAIKEGRFEDARKSIKEIQDKIKW